MRFADLARDKFPGKSGTAVLHPCSCCAVCGIERMHKLFESAVEKNVQTPVLAGTGTVGYHRTKQVCLSAPAPQYTTAF